MAFKINDFTSNLSRGGARPNLFKVTLTQSAIISQLFGTDEFSFLCKNAQIPASIVSTIPVTYNGRETKFSGDREFNEFTTTVFNDEGYQIRNVIESWMNGLNSHSENTRDFLEGGRSSYTQDITLETFSKDGTTDQIYKFVGCWPSNLDAMPLSWDSQNAIMEFTITWQYDYYTHSSAGIS